MLFLALGIGVAYFVLPFAVGFMLGFAIPGVIEPLITADAYFGFVTNLFLAFGLVMEFPIVLVLLSKIGIVSAQQLRRNRRYVFLGIFIFAVVVTPGGDPFSPTDHGSRDVSPVRADDPARGPWRQADGAAKQGAPGGAQ